jgi:CheY-like chemotaxis protein/two-component sensor histidine kinase
LTGGIAHDFNNILTVVIGFSDILLSHIEEQDLRHSYVKTIKEAGERASSLINQLLAFSRKQILKPKVINVNSIVSQMKKMLRHLIGEDIELTTNLEQDLDNAKLDSSQIEQVIMNLCINAMDAMPHGGKLTIETANVYLNEEYSRNHVSLEPGHYVMLVVIDNGIGMNQEIQERMFEPFFTTKEDSKGTGLGLSTVYGIIKQSNGSIWTYSEPGKGTTFKIYVPSVRKEPEDEKDLPASQPSLQGTETVLLVEDEGFVRDVASSILKSFGYRVLTARCGEEALKIVNKMKNQSIDLMLTDVIMPGMSGTKLADKIKIKSPGIKIMFMSGYADEAIVHHGILDNEIPFIKKPFNMRDLGKQVREVLDTRDKTTSTAQV